MPHAWTRSWGAMGSMGPRWGSSSAMSAVTVTRWLCQKGRHWVQSRNQVWVSGSGRAGAGHCQRLDQDALCKSTAQTESAIADLADHRIAARDDADGPPFKQPELSQTLILTEFPCAYATDPVRSIALNRSQWQYVRRHPPSLPSDCEFCPAPSAAPMPPSEPAVFQSTCRPTVSLDNRHPSRY